MAVKRVDRNTTAVNKSQVAIKYIFDLAVRNVRGQISSIFSSPEPLGSQGELIGWP